MAVRWWRWIYEIFPACVWLVVGCLAGLPVSAQVRSAATGPGSPRSGPVVITNFAALRGMSAAPPPVRLSGVITYYDDAQDVGFLQEGDAGVAFVPGAFVGGAAPRPGVRAELTGVTAPGEFAPIVTGGTGSSRAVVRVLGRSSLPACRPDSGGG